LVLALVQVMQTSIMEPTFAFNHVIEHFTVHALALCEGEDEIFIALRKDKTIKRTIIPDNLLYIIDVELG
jgi:hypothetical protein